MFYLLLMSVCEFIRKGEEKKDLFVPNTKCMLINIESTS